VILETNVARIALQRFSMAEGERIPRQIRSGENSHGVSAYEKTRNRFNKSYTDMLLGNLIVGEYRRYIQIIRAS
jgi:hypothetical protein